MAEDGRGNIQLAAQTCRKESDIIFTKKGSKSDSQTDLRVHNCAQCLSFSINNYVIKTGMN